MDEAVINIGGEYLTIVTSFYLLFTAMFVYGGVMRGAGDTIIPMFLTLFSLWIITYTGCHVPEPGNHYTCLGIYNSGVPDLGEEGIWWSIPAGWGIRPDSFLFSIIRPDRWKTKSVVKVKVEPATITR